MLEEQLGEALDAAADEILELFLTKYVDKFAYIKNPKVYDRTFEFRRSWEFSELEKTARGLSRELYFNEMKMQSFDTDSFHHGSKYSLPQYVGDILPSVLEGKKSKLWLSVTRKVKFWDRFVEDMFAKGKLDKIMNKHLVKKGFRRVS